MIAFTIPMKTVSEANMREHHHVKARRTRAQKSDAYLHTMAALRASTWPPTVKKLVITLTRIGPVRIDKDNAVGALKHVQDGVAKALGIDDGDDRLTWVYAREKGPYAVRVDIKATTGKVAA